MNDFSEIDVSDGDFLKISEAFLSEYMRRLGPGEIRIAVSDKFAGQAVECLNASIELIHILSDSPLIPLYPIEIALPIIEAAQKSVNQLTRLRGPFSKQVARSELF